MRKKKTPEELAREAEEGEQDEFTSKGVPGTHPATRYFLFLVLQTFNHNLFKGVSFWNIHPLTSGRFE